MADKVNPQVEQYGKGPGTQALEDLRKHGLTFDDVIKVKAGDLAATWSPECEGLKSVITELSKDDKQELYEWMHDALGLRIYKP